MRANWCQSVAVLIVVLALVPAVAADDPVKLIFDTDMGNDVDDALALGVIHALQSRGEAELLAVTITKDNHQAGEFVDAVNHFYGRGEIPIGMVQDGKTPDIGKFLPLARVKDGDELRYPHDLTADTPVPPAVEVLRKTLAAQPAKSVVIVQVGFSTNLAALLDSLPDENSPLPGEELVRQKVKRLSLMGGAFQKIDGKTGYGEYNIKIDLPAAQAVAKRWPTPIIFSGYEIGIALRYPAVSIEEDFDYVPHHPLAEAYQLYQPTPHERPTWDLTSVLYAVRPARGYFGLSEPGRVTVNDDNSTTFKPAADGPHRYLTLTDDQIIRAREALVQLTSQPPAKQ